MSDANGARAERGGAGDGSEASGSTRASRGMARRRRIVKTVVFLSIVVGLFAGVGWGSLSSFGYGAIAYLCPLGALEALAAAKTAVSRFLIALLVMVAVVAVLGRAFCSWVCPVPSIESFFHGKGKRDRAAQEQTARTPSADGDGQGAAGDAPGEPAGGLAGDSTGEPADGQLNGPAGSRPSGSASSPACSPACGPAGELRALTDEERSLLSSTCAESGCASCLAPVGGARDHARFDSRHGVLLGSVAAAAIFGFPVFCLVCPVGLSIATVIAVWQLVFAHEPSWSLVVFPLIVLVEVVFFRKWCFKLCPMGALMSLIGRRSLFKPSVDDRRCLRAKGIDCRRCVEACPELLDPHSDGLAECSKCGACADECPAHAIRMPALRAKR